jgi:hypothetical protein
MLLSALLFAVAVSAYTPLVTFDGARSTTHKWQAVNDPVRSNHYTVGNNHYSVINLAGHGRPVLL